MVCVCVNFLGRTKTVGCSHTSKSNHPLHIRQIESHFQVRIHARRVPPVAHQLLLEA